MTTGDKRKVSEVDAYEESDGIVSQQVRIKAAALPAGAATSAAQTAQTALTGTVRHTTTPSKADAATGPAEVSKIGAQHIAADPRHFRRLHKLATASGAYTTFGSLPEGPCNAVRVESVGSGAVVYGQPPERPALLVQTPAAWPAVAGWSYGVGALANVATHANPGGVTPLVQDTATTNPNDPIGIGWTYAVVVTVTGRANGTLTPFVGTTAAAAAIAVDGTYCFLITAAANQTVSLVPTNTFDGSVDVSTIWAFPRGPELTPNQWESMSLIKVVAVATQVAPGTFPATPIQLWAAWYRNPGATELT